MLLAGLVGVTRRTPTVLVALVTKRMRIVRRSMKMMSAGGPTELHTGKRNSTNVT
jgi:hypothetical protein